MKKEKLSLGELHVSSFSTSTSKTIRGGYYSLGCSFTGGCGQITACCDSTANENNCEVSMQVSECIQGTGCVVY